MNKKQLIVAWILMLFLSGCATFDSTYYTNPNSQGYTQQVLGGICEQCGRQFTFSAQQYDQNVQIQCCYCGHTQDIKMAYNRYLYAQQQAQEQQQQANSQALMQKLYEDARPQTHSYSNPGMDYLNYLRNRPATSYYTPPTQTRCHYDPMGDFICDTSGSGGHSTTRCHRGPSGDIVCDTSRY